MLEVNQQVSGCRENPQTDQTPNPIRHTHYIPFTSYFEIYGEYRRFSKYF